MELLLAGLIGFVAAFIGQMSAGTGLITIPLLIVLGYPPQITIASNKVGVLGMGLFAFPKYLKSKKIIWDLVLPLSMISLISALIGARILINFDPNLLSKFIGVVILVLLPFVFFSKNSGVKRIKVSKTKKIFGYIAYTFTAFYKSFFGAGSGIFFNYVYLGLFGTTVLEYKGTNKIPGMLVDIVAVSVFIIAGLVDYKLAFVLFLSMGAGSYLGAHVALNKGNNWVKWLLVAVIIISAIKLLFF